MYYLISIKVYNIMGWKCMLVAQMIYRPKFPPPVGRSLVDKKLSAIQTLAVICTQLEQDASAEKIKESLDLEDNTFSFYVEFALESKWLVRNENGKYKITITGKEFISSILS
jgi:hypothetical protein